MKAYRTAESDIVRLSSGRPGHLKAERYSAHAKRVHDVLSTRPVGARIRAG